jgi:hypothetical protein
MKTMLDPTLRKVMWERWKIISKIVGHIHAQVVTVLFYFTIFVPFAIGVRLLSDPLRMKTLSPKWLDRKPVLTSLDDARRQF